MTTVTWCRGGNHTGTGYTGEINCSYAKLVKVFGEPSAGDGYKVDAHWVLTFITAASNVVVTIYNYKTSRNYLGPGAPAIEAITEWHIGGKQPGVVALVEAALAEAA